MRGEGKIGARTKFLARVGSTALAIALAIALAATAGSALGQTQGTPPTREEIERQLPERELERDPALSIDAGLDRTACPLAEPQFADIRFTLADVQFTGAEGIEPGLLASSWNGLAGQEIGVARICDIRDRASELLRQAGYVATVQVPPQAIDTGVVRFDVVIARLTGLVIRGDAGPSGAMIESYFEKLRGEPHFNRREAERMLLLARDIPGMDIRFSLTRDAGGAARPGDLIGIVDVIFDRFEADVAVQNWSGDATGPFGASLRTQINGLTGLADLTELSVYSAQDWSEQVVVQGRHEFGIGNNGLRLGASAIHAWTQPDVPGPDVFDATTLIASLYAAYPLQRSQTANWNLSGGFEWIDQDLEFSGLPLSEDELRVAFLRVESSFLDPRTVEGLAGYSLSEPRWSVYGMLEARQGLDIFGASRPCGAGFANCFLPGRVPLGRLDGDPSAFILRGQGQVDYRPAPLWTISLKPRFQYSPDALLSYEQFSGGNFTIGRGYDPGSVVGDSGIGAQLELSYGSLLPDRQDGIAWQPFVFYDSLAAWTKNVTGDPVTLRSLGGGLRANIARRAFVEVVGAVPLKRSPLQLERGDARLLVNFVMRLGD
ncbi:MAG: ShlB/FhaC/HecB family hemolysin secretion/activation protein [Qipengyuania sp.]